MNNESLRLGAIARAAAQALGGPIITGPDGTHTGWCLRETRRLYRDEHGNELVPAVADDAAEAWELAQHKHRFTNPGNPTPAELAAIPPGVPMFWLGGSEGHGHVAPSRSQLGTVWCTDWHRPGYFDAAAIADIGPRWGMLAVGWAEDLNGVRVYEPPTTRGRHVDAAERELRDALGNVRNPEGKRAGLLRRALRSLRRIPARIAR